MEGETRRNETRLIMSFDAMSAIFLSPFLLSERLGVSLRHQDFFAYASFIRSAVFTTRRCSRFLHFQLRALDLSPRITLRCQTFPISRTSPLQDDGVPGSYPSAYIYARRRSSFTKQKRRSRCRPLFPPSPLLRGLTTSCRPVSSLTTRMHIYIKRRPGYQERKKKVENAVPVQIESFAFVARLLPSTSHRDTLDHPLFSLPSLG